LNNDQDWGIPVVQCSGLGDTCCTMFRTGGYMSFIVPTFCFVF